MNRLALLVRAFLLIALIAAVRLSKGVEASIPSFIILVTSYNNEKYVSRNLRSLLGQRSSRPYRIIYVNDCSSDRTGAAVESFIKKHKLSPPFIEVIHNKERAGAALENIYRVVHGKIADDEVVVSVDGDDFLAHKGVLERLEKEYADPAVWMTFGRFVVIPGGELWGNCWSYPEETIVSRSFRSSSIVPSHLKTFKAWLFKEIREEDLYGPDGTFFKKAGDMAFMFPLLEMCAPASQKGINHSRFIEDTILYLYNADTGFNDHTLDRDQQINMDLFIRSKRQYEPLDSN